MTTIFSRSLLKLGDQLTGLIRARLWLQVIVGMMLGVGTGILIGPSAGLVAQRLMR